MKLKLAAIVGVLMLVGCSKPTDYGKPHAYVKAVVASDEYMTMDNNDHQYVGLGVIPKQNWFKPNSEECMNFINEIRPAEVDVSMQGFNNYLTNSGDLNDKPVRHVRFICIEYKGEIPGCKDDLKEHLEKFMEENNFPENEKNMGRLRLEFEAINRCRDEAIIGKSELFHHFGYENERPGSAG